MKRLIPLFLFGVSTLLIPVSYAETSAASATQEQDHQVHHPDQQTSTDAQITLQKADTKIAELSELQKKAGTATSAREQKAIQAEQMQLMQECMSMMSMMSKESQAMMKPEDMMLRQQMMDKRMDMMQMMMQMMLDQQASPVTKK